MIIGAAITFWYITIPVLLLVGVIWLWVVATRPNRTPEGRTAKAARKAERRTAKSVSKAVEQERKAAHAVAKAEAAPASEAAKADAVTNRKRRREVEHDRQARWLARHTPLYRSYRPTAPTALPTPPPSPQLGSAPEEF